MTRARSSRTWPRRWRWAGTAWPISHCCASRPIAALACELLAGTQLLALTGAARRREPKRLRLRLLSVAGRLARSGRRAGLRLAQRRPWAADISTATARLQAIPTG